ncbi:putative MIZ/SP-RING zinc finger [Blattamonas nauphoetae]|uniref:MIZ/SP-RING zinc finger n=1 Tax=Blattamonas nauphoetae TaxID=2049346 RepID=A0ABQ9XTA2_9EUKA|nr:putative MIZ/SP-RING zinc finger [Blattamonas nauphoetae]
MIVDSSTANSPYLDSQAVANSSSFRQTLDPFYKVVEILPAFPLETHIPGRIDISKYYDELLKSARKSSMILPQKCDLRLHLRCFSLGNLEIPLNWERNIRINGSFIDCTLPSNTAMRARNKRHGQQSYTASFSLDITPYIFKPVLIVTACDTNNSLDGTFVPMVVYPRTVDDLIEDLRASTIELQKQCDQWQIEENARLLLYLQLENEKMALSEGIGTRTLEQIEADQEAVHVEMDNNPFPSAADSYVSPNDSVMHGFGYLQDGPSYEHNVENDEVVMFAKKRVFRMENDVSEIVSAVTLKCPLMFTRIEIPAKGKNCTHRQCFDLRGFLQYSSRDRQYVCPVCHKATPFSDLVIDLNMERILKTVSADVERVVVMDDARFEVETSNKSQIACQSRTFFERRKERKVARHMKIVEQNRRDEDERQRRKEEKRLRTDPHAVVEVHGGPTSASQPLTIRHFDGKECILIDDD